ncbi:LptF/LptG family permease [Caminibacter sp.]
MYFRYLFFKYIKNFFIVLISLSLLFVIMDYIYNIESLPKSSNLQVLYVFYMFIYATFVIYPLAIIFSFLMSLNHHIKFNELVSFYSLGFKPKKILFPFLFSAVVIFLFFSLLQSTKISYANQYANAIKSNMNLTNKNLFLKFQNYIIYFKSLNPIVKHAYGVKIFEINNSKIQKVISAKIAVYKDNIWECKNANILTLSKDEWKSEIKTIKILKNFKPKIISNLKMLDNISFYDAYIAIKYFKDIDLNKILSIVFFKIFTPLTLIVFMIYLFFNAPIHIRISNVVLFMIKSVTFSLLLWGVMLMIYKFTKQGILPYYVLSLPFLILLLIDIIVLRRNND